MVKSLIIPPGNPSYLVLLSHSTYYISHSRDLDISES